MRVSTQKNQAAAQDSAPESPLKRRQNLTYSHFSKHSTTQLDEEAGIFSMRFSSDASYLATSLTDGSIQIVSPALGSQLHRIQDYQMIAPITSLTWKPNHTGIHGEHRLLGACLNGSIVRWRESREGAIEHIKLNKDQRYHAIDYANDGRRFCVAGSQPYIEIYDEERNKRLQQIGDRVNPAHTNKIFTCRFNPQTPNMLVSGSWDRQVRFWDVRASRLSVSIGGRTSICGDGVDLSNCNNYVVTGGGTLGEGVQVWDMRCLEEPISKMTWEIAYNGDTINPCVNAVRFVPGQDMVLAGCSENSVSVKCFNYKMGNTATEEFSTINGNCFSLDASQSSDLVSFGDSSGTLHLYKVNYTQ